MRLLLTALARARAAAIERHIRSRRRALRDHIRRETRAIEREARRARGLRLWLAWSQPISFVAPRNSSAKPQPQAQGLRALFPTVATPGPLFKEATTR